MVTPRPAPILAVTKSDDRDPVGRGEPLVYTIGIENTGEATATAIVITDFYPEGFEFQEAEPPPTAGLNTWELPTLPPGESYEIVIGGTVSFSVPAGTVLVNEVTVTAAELPLIETTEETQVTETIPGRLRNNVRP
jgi:uncharacterized repeat protein (TIGR01451 family)